MPSTKVEPSVEPTAQVEPADAADELQKTSDEATQEAIMAPEQEELPRPSADRTKRVHAPSVKPRPVKLIPGDRTKGLSVDEF